MPDSHSDNRAGRDIPGDEPANSGSDQPDKPQGPEAEQDEADQEVAELRWPTIPEPPMIPAIPESLLKPSETETAFRTRFAKAPKTEMRALGLGIEFASMFAGGVALGWVVGKAFGGTTTWMFIGGVFGLLTGGSIAIRGGLRMSRAFDEADRVRGGRGASEGASDPERTPQGDA